ncbi:FAD-binding protein [Microbacterium sp.]|uniref:FAD-binding protein n=1 Tax=Microbacterium sp. TaxID=51671 RepID=UPI0039E29F19
MATNWAGSHTYRAARIVRPGSVAELQELLASSSGPVHALGTRHSFTDLPDTEGTLIDVTGLPPELALDEQARTVTVAAGVRYGELALWLQERGWALHNLGSLPHINVGGATATGTHGSGDRNRVLSSAVRALRWVDAAGAVHDTTAADPDFDALVVGVGAFGVVVALTLAVEPTYRVRQDVYDGITWRAALADLDALTSAGYSVSAFTMWDADDLGPVWVKTRLDTDDDPVPDTLLDGTRRTGPSADDAENFTVRGGVPGPWMLRLPHFRLDAVPSAGEELQTEYFVDRTDAAAALRAVHAQADRIRPCLIASELRTAARDTLWLSPAYERDVVGIHFTWRLDPVGVGAVIPFVEEALRPFAARPHWGKVHGFDRTALEAVHPRLGDARAVFERLDPDGRFANAHLVRVGIRS